MAAETTQPPAVLWCDNPEHAEAGSAIPAVFRVTWPDGRFRPLLACKDCLKDSLSLYVLNGDSDGRRHPALIEIASPGETPATKALRDAGQLEAAAAILNRRYPATRPDELDHIISSLQSLARTWRRMAAQAPDRAAETEATL